MVYRKYNKKKRPEEAGVNSQYVEEVLTEAATSSQIDFKFLLFRQIERINFCLVNKPELFPANVEALETMMTPRFDSVYKERLDQMKKRSKRLESDIFDNSMISNTSINLSGYDFKLAMIRYKELMKLMDRKGFYPDERIIEDEAY